ncbi:MAG: hypothetical protein IIC79_02200 [Chloroflexi bacterium]|nr:hypothetical protein [Chloroflexota bacterium]
MTAVITAIPSALDKPRCSLKRKSIKNVRNTGQSIVSCSTPNSRHTNGRLTASTPVSNAADCGTESCRDSKYAA